jgi:uncharacterized protein (DUF1501 family)
MERNEDSTNTPEAAPMHYPAHAAPPWPEYQPQAALPISVHNSRRNRRRIIIGVALALLAIGITTGALVEHNNQSAGFNNPDTLAADLKTNIQARANDPKSDHYLPGAVILGVNCIAMSQAHQFSCIATVALDGQTGTSTTIATVSADGSSYITQ